MAPDADNKAQRAHRVADEWMRHLPQEIWLAPNIIQLPSDKVAPVVEGKQAKAQAALQEVSWQKLSAEDAKEYLSQELACPPGNELILLRGLFLEPSHGKFSAYWHDGVVLVRYGCLGRHQVTQKRKAVVAVLPAFPKDVFVDCEMAQ